jgi:hypothetical protein
MIFTTTHRHVVTEIESIEAQIDTLQQQLQQAYAQAQALQLLESEASSAIAQVQSVISMAKIYQANAAVPEYELETFQQALMNQFNLPVAALEPAPEAEVSQLDNVVSSEPEIDLDSVDPLDEEVQMETVVQADDESDVSPVTDKDTVTEASEIESSYVPQSLNDSDLQELAIDLSIDNLEDLSVPLRGFLRDRTPIDTPFPEDFPPQLLEDKTSPRLPNIEAESELQQNLENMTLNQLKQVAGVSHDGDSCTIASLNATELRKCCTKANIQWRNVHGPGKHLKKSEMLHRLTA